MVDDVKAEKQSFWRTADPVLDGGEQGAAVLTGGLFPHQRDWWNLSEFCKLLVGGFGSGKTLPLCKRLIGLTIANAPCAGMVVSPTFPMARRTTVRELIRLLEGKRANHPRRLEWQHNKTSHEFKIRWDRGPSGTLWYASGDDADRLKGPNLAFVGIDEPFTMPQSVFDVMLSRIRDPDAVLKELLLTGTPEQLNWGYELVEGELGDDLTVGVVHASTDLNRALDPMFMRRLLAAYDERAALAFVHGQFVNLSKGQVFYKFRPSTQCLKEDPRPPTDVAVQHFAGMDFNVSPMAFCAGWHAAYRGGTHRVHFYREWELENSDTPDACSALRTETPLVTVVYPDPTGNRRQTNSGHKTDHELIRQAGYEVDVPYNPHGRRDSFNAVNACYREDSKVHVTFGPRCRHLKRYSMHWSHENLNTEAGRKMSHLMDALRYSLTQKFPIVKSYSSQERLVGA